MNFTDALAALAQMHNPTIDDLRALVRSTEVNIPATVRATVLYSGGVGEVHSNDIARALAQADPSISIIDNTEVAKLLASSEFVNKLNIAVGDATQVNSILFGTNGGFWSDASARFAQAASGEIITITPDAASNRIFSQVELPNIINNHNITTIDGIPREALLDRYNSILLSTGNQELALGDIFGKISDKSFGSISQYVQVGRDGAGGLTVKIAEEFFRNNGVEGIGYLDTSAGGALAPASELFSGAFYESRALRMAQTAEWLGGLKSTGKLLGPVGDLLSLTLAAVDIKASLDAGDREGAARKATTFLGGFAGGALSASLAAQLASPLLLGGPVGWVAYGVIVVGAGFVGSVGGEKAVNWLFDGVAGQFFGRDNSGLFVDVYQRGADGQLYVSRVRQSLEDGEIVFGSLSEPEGDEIVVTAYRNGAVRGAYIRHRTPGGNEAQLILSPELLVAFEDGFRAFLDAGGTLIGGASSGSGAGYNSVGAGPQNNLPALSVTRNPDGTIAINGRVVRAIAEDPRNPQGAIISVPTSIDSLGREISIDLYFDGTVLRPTGAQRVRDGAVEIRTEPGQPTTIHLVNSPIGIDFVNAAETIATTFGRYLVGGNILVETVTSAALQTLGSNLGDVLNAEFFDSGTGTTKNINQAFNGIGQEFITNLQDAGIGAISSFLTAELVHVLGLGGLEGQAAGGLANYAITTMAQNLADIAGGAEKSIFDGLDNLTNLGNIAGSFIGNTLANEIGSWDEIGEQLGSSIGGTLGGVAGQALIPVPVIGAIIGSLLGNLLGGLIGGIFTGTPKSGAIVGFDKWSGQFAVTDVWKEDGGKKQVARQLGNAAAATMNGILDDIGGTLVNADQVDAGSYGMRGKRYEYWIDDTSSSNRITFENPTDLIEYGVMKAAKNFEFLGGDVYAKRAFYATLALGYQQSSSADNIIDPEDLGVGQTLASVDFGLDVLLGNLAVVDRLHTYLMASTAINGLIAAEPNSVFTADWILALSRATDLGLLKRNEHDWDGGFSYLLEAADVDARDVRFQFSALGHEGNGERVTYLRSIEMDDTVDSGSKTVIQGGNGADVLSERTGGTRTDAIDPSSTNHIANVFHGGAGDDEIFAGNTGDDLFGDDGNDLLVGGKLDDWLFGGSGNDVLDAGGGNGNVLSGGDGNDRLVGADWNPTKTREDGSDWLNGGAGDDRIQGRGGDDYVEGGQGKDRIDGGTGSDTVIYRFGDGVDLLADTGKSAAGHDVLDFGAGIDPAHVTVIARSSGVDMSLVIGSAAAGDRIDLRGAAFTLQEGMEEYRFTGTSWTRGDMTSKAVFAKSAGMTFAGTASDESLTGTMYDDTLSGGGGHDTLAGGYGSDTYLFNLGDRVVTIDESGFAADLDSLVFGAGIQLSDISVAHNAASPQDIILNVGTSGDRVVLRHQSLTDGTQSIEEVRFQDGTSLTLRDIQNLAAPSFTSGADTALGFDSNDTFDSGAGDDTLTGGLGNDNLRGGDGNDTYIYNIGDGNDRIAENYYGGFNTLVLGAGIDASELVLTRDVINPNNIRISFNNRAGSILLQDQDYAGGSGGGGVSAIHFADGTVWNKVALDAHLTAQQISAGNDIIVDGPYNGVIDAGAGNDVVYAGGGDDIITGGLGDDDLNGGDGNDTYYYNAGDGNDRIAENYYGGYNTLVFGAGINLAHIVVTRDAIDSNNLRISFSNQAGSILLEDQNYGGGYGGTGVSLVRFADGTTLDKAALDALLVTQSVSSLAEIVSDGTYGNVIATGAGNDVVYGGGGDDTITGGGGNDDLNGGDGNDTYYYNAGNGNDRIAENYYGGFNTLVLGAGIDPADIVLTRDVANGNNLRISFNNRDGSILLQDQNYGGGYGGTGVAEVHFADGTVWNKAALDALLVTQSVSGLADIVSDGTYGNVIATGAGNDVVYGGGGDDEITGGLGDDDLNGGDGNDTYYYNAGDGNDRIAENYYGGYNTLVFGAGINLAHIVVTRDAIDSNNLRISFSNQAGSILLEDQNYGGGYGGTGVSLVRFADGTTLDKAALDALAPQLAAMTWGTNAADTIVGTGGDDRISAGEGNDTLTGGEGNDYLAGGSGDDTYVFNLGDGHDTIVEELGFDTVQFGAGISASDLVITPTLVDGDTSGMTISIVGTSDSIYLRSTNSGDYHNEIDRFVFADGTILTSADLRSRLILSLGTAGEDQLYGTGFNDAINGGAGDDRIYANGGNDTLTGGAGDDYLAGGSGDDTYVFNLGDGHDTIVEELGTDTVQFGAGITVADLILSQTLVDGDTSGMTISIAGTNDSLYLRSTNSGDYHNEIDRFVFADGTILTSADLRSRLILSLGTAGEDQLYGTGFNDAINGGAGDDRIYANGGNDTLTGGAGDDYLAGGSGDDTYVFNLGDGHDTIVEELGTDTVQFGAGITVADLILSQTLVDGDTSGMTISIAGTNDSLYLRSTNSGDYHNEIDRFVFADGTILTSADLRSKLMGSYVTPGDDLLYGTGFADIIVAGGGDDRVESGNGNDKLVGGKGNDYLSGGSGDDIYVFNLGDGQDTVSDYSGNDTLQFGTGIDEDDIVVSQSTTDDDGQGVVLSIKGTHDKIYLNSGLAGYYYRIENVKFNSGAIWTTDTLVQMLRGTTIGGNYTPVSMGDDVILGSSGNDTIRGMKGDDVLRGGMGSDTYIFARGDGYDTIYDPTDGGATDKLILENIVSTAVKVMVSPTDDNDIVLYVDDDNIIYLDQQRVSATSGIEVLQFADGVIWDRQTLASKAAGSQATSGNDTLIGSNFSDTLSGGAGNDTLIGAGGADTYLYNPGDGDDLIVDDGSASNLDVLSFGAGITLADLRLVQLVEDGPLVISFASQSGSITLQGQDPGGASGVGILRFADGSTIFMSAFRQSTLGARATSGDDIIKGFATADVIHGGAGNDTLIGGRGADIYHFQLGDGSDSIVETGDGANNILAFGAGITAADIRLSRTASAPDDLILSLSSGTDRVTLKNQFTASGFAGLQEVRFADGTTWLARNFETLLLAQPASAGDDYLVGDDRANTIDGLAGNDLIIGGTGDDILYGSGGNDVLYGGRGADKLYGGTGDDILSGDQGADTLDGGDGIDTADYSFSLDNWSINLATGIASIVGSQDASAAETLISIENVVGGLGNDQIVGDDGANRIRGAEGDDSLVGAGGDDVFFFDGAEEGIDAIDGGAGADRIEALSDDTIIGLSTLTNVEVITANGHSNVVIGATDGNDTLDLSAATLDGISRILLGRGDDILTGSLGADRIDAGAGNDIIRASGVSTGADDIDGGDGADRIEASGDGTVLYLRSFSNVERISGAGYQGVVVRRTNDAETTDLTKIAFDGISRFDLDGGNDVFVGDQQANRVKGGGGDDTLDGGDGDDVFEFVGTNGGHDVIIGGAGHDKLVALADGAVIGLRTISGIEVISGEGHAGVLLDLTEGDDVLDLSGLAVSDIAGIRAGAGDDVLHGSTGADVFLRGGDEGYDDVDGDGGVDRIQAIADGTVIGLKRVANVEAITAAGFDNVSISLTAGNDNIDFTGVTLTGIVAINAGAGNDKVIGSAGGDTLRGGLGDDELIGGSGDDVYRFDLGDGDDVIREHTSTVSGGGNDTLTFGAGILAANVHVTLENGGQDFLLSISGTSDTVKLVNAATSSQNAWVEQIRFADGTTWDRARLLQELWISGSAGDETLNGTSFDDTLVGGAGNDTLLGAGGSDTYRYASGDGNDRIDDTGSASDIDVLRLTDLNAADVSLRRDGSHLYMRDMATGEEVKIDWQFWSDATYGIEQIAFADGTVWDRSRIQQEAWIRGGSANDSLYGTALGETLAGNGGDDYLEGRGGGDIYRYASGDGSDEIYEDGSVGDIDVLKLIDLNPEDVTLSRNGHQLYVVDTTTGKQVKVSYQFYSDERYAIEQIQFADGTTWDRARIALETGAINGTTGADQIVGTSGADVIRARGGSDLLDGGAGNDDIDGGAGNDTIFGGEGNDTIVGGAGDDVIDGDAYGLVATGANLIVNGSFETAGTIVGSGGWGRAVSSMPGWTISSSQAVEQVYSGFAGIAATDGSYWLDMDAGGGAGSNADISQTIAGLDAGDTLLLLFDHANRTSAANGAFEVYWNGGLIATIDQTGTTMVTTSFSVTAIAGDNVLRFKGLGNEDNTGASLENVRLYPATNQAYGAGDDVVTGGVGNDILNGGGGFDVARYAGLRDDYQLSTLNGVVTVTDLAPGIDGNDGIDQLTGFEQLAFRDGTTVSLVAPIVLDLNGDGVSLVDHTASGAAFDWNGDGRADVTGWIDPNDGFLALDRNGDGLIAGANELGFVGDNPGATSDLDGLSAFDTNGDGLLSAADTAFGDFRVWRDANGNGISDQGELLSLSDAGVGSISLSGIASSRTWQWDENIVINYGTYTRTDGTIAALQDVMLNYRTQAQDSEVGVMSMERQSIRRQGAGWQQLASPLARMPVDSLDSAGRGGVALVGAHVNAARLAEQISAFMPTASSIWEGGDCEHILKGELFAAALRPMRAADVFTPT